MADAVASWHALVEGDRHGAPLCGTLADRMRQRRLTFGDRLLCPFLRPFFLEPRDEARVALAAEKLWVVGERIARAAFDDPSLMNDLGLSDEERRFDLLRI